MANFFKKLVSGLTKTRNNIVSNFPVMPYAAMAEIL